MFSRRSRDPLVLDRPDDVTVVRVSMDERTAYARPRPDPRSAWKVVRRVVAEALILQDEAEALLDSFRRRPDRGEGAEACGRLRFRFVTLHKELPEAGVPDIDRLTAALRQVLDHHVLMLKTSQQLLAGAALSDALDARLDDIDGLGAP